ncbi:MAG: DUF1697 domain-containing protein [Frankiales bacterium]|nr:DUF1697 domain-containing protein [Frankiales bacterium]
MSPASPARVAVLLRGVNVGRAKRIAMADFAALLRDVGLTDVRTLLNSGNGIGTWAGRPDSLATIVSGAMQDAVGFTCDVVVRTEEHLDAVLARDPLGAVASNPSWYLVTFLGSAPDAEALARFEALDLSPDDVVLDGLELYAWMPNGVNESPTGKALARGVLGVTWTGRNWTTVTKLRDLMRQE